MARTNGMNVDDSSAMMASRTTSRRRGHPTHTWSMPVGASLQPDGVRFRVWAPKRQRAEMVLTSPRQFAVPMTPEPDGYFTIMVPQLGAGARYWFRLDGEGPYPDPCSRFQPDGPHGPSMVVDPAAYAWHVTDWPGITIHGQVIYELHLGTFTPEGTCDAAIAKLDDLKDVGITLLEIMPVADFPGRWNWGYDGVDLYAPSRVYGDPHALKRLVDAAHEHGLGAMLDVVYNHFGPDGNYLGAYSDDYFTDRYENEWGAAINFDGPTAKPVRDFFIHNACYWIHEFRFDGLRFDATQSIHDHGPRHILAELSERTREAAGKRTIVLTAENEPQDVRLVRPIERGGFGLDSMWHEDFHHSAMVALTGFREAYYTDYRGQPEEFLAAVKRGLIYQGQFYAWQGQPRGSVVDDEPASAFVCFLQNHDQVANTLAGDRIHALTSPAHYRAMAALWLLGPNTPLFFMGQEFGASTPFCYFVDHGPELAALVHKGRKEFLAQFPSYASPEAQAAIPDPSNPSLFMRSKLDWTERRRHAAIVRFHRDLLRLRRDDPVIAAQDRQRIDGARLAADAFVLRYFARDGADRLLVINLGTQSDCRPAPEPLLSMVGGRLWQLVWSSNDPQYGGPDALNPYTPLCWHLPATSASLLVPGDAPAHNGHAVRRRTA